MRSSYNDPFIRRIYGTSAVLFIIGCVPIVLSGDYSKSWILLLLLFLGSATVYRAVILNKILLFSFLTSAAIALLLGFLFVRFESLATMLLLTALPIIWVTLFEQRIQSEIAKNLPENEK